MSFKVVIPARYASSRLPGKPLADIAGKPMVVRVAERAAQSGAAEVLVATDHEEVHAAVRSHGFVAVMTRSDHASGTDRIAEVAGQYNWSDDIVVVNVQGDEPFIEPGLINQVAGELAADADAAIATACHSIGCTEDFFNPNIVKVVLSARGDALYFSRAPIPYARDHFAREAGGETLPHAMLAYRHVGLYAYRAHFLRTYNQLAPSPLEGIEALEQLRALWHGFRISVAIVDHLPVAGVDTPEDARRMQEWFKKV